MSRSTKQSADPVLHPGKFVRTTIIGPLRISVKEAALVLGVHRVALSRLLNEQAALSPEMAIRLEKAFGADLEALMRMQNDFDIARAREHKDEITVARYVPPVVNHRQPKLI
ncbi:MAG: HigA family addiction module antidote protein [Desulfomicrobium sp.]|uniref:HigA family addiction module antitoxin n=1 Tax=Hoeflea sp. TaxID=1940281 RepID=UPI0025BDA135|nr:HigA family addiction module antitoxin [Hoeflea sp.]MBV1711578.1 HigA family addiction module antidote protein [Desulfomicrobium sp.]MBV1782302.1 HigA family addiction module antidote protein [Hoeflea sp.]